MILRYTQTSRTVQLAQKGLKDDATVHKDIVHSSVSPERRWTVTLRYRETSCTVQLAQKGPEDNTTVHTDIMHSSVSPEGAGG